MTFRFMDDYRKRWSVRMMARVLEVSPSGYYSWKKRKPSTRVISDRALVARIREIQKRHKRRYGSPRVHAELCAMGLNVGRIRVARLMRLNDLSCLPRRRFKVTTDSRHHEPVAPNILDRQFDVKKPNTVWVSDITYLPTAEGWLYLCVVIDELVNLASLQAGGDGERLDELRLGRFVSHSPSLFTRRIGADNYSAIVMTTPVVRLIALMMLF